jgi:hypothetical protein
MTVPRRLLLLCALGLTYEACATGPGSPSAPPGRPIQVDDAVILALREQGDIALDRQLLEQFRQLLRVARTVVSAPVAAIHARPDSDYREVGVEVTGEIATAFSQDSLRTGSTKLDALLARFDLTSIRRADSTIPQDPSSRPFHWYWLTFQGPIQTRRLATAILDLHIAEIAHAEPNGTIGDGDDIRAIRGGAGWTIMFIHGEGDCPAGCIQHTRTSVFVDAGGEAHLLGDEK